jgi:hypothetical protein
MGELKGKGASYFKFVNIGDNIVGRFGEYRPNQPNPFDASKPQNDLVLITDENAGAKTIIHCPAALKNIIETNLKDLTETQPTLKVTYTGDGPKKPGKKPVKLFKVETLDL